MKKITFLDIIKGKFIYHVKKEVWNIIFIVLVFFFLAISISNYIDNKIIELNKLKNQVEEIKSRNVYMQSELIKIKLESELSQELQKDSLKALEAHPLKILVK